MRLFSRSLTWAAIGSICTFAVAPVALAQRDPLGGLAEQRERVVPPPMTFASAEEHYNFLQKRANGGTKHTVNSLPDWSGIWQSGITTMSMQHPVDAPLSPLIGPL